MIAFQRLVGIAPDDHAHPTWLAAQSLIGMETLATREDGWVEVALPAGEPAWIASWVLSYGPDAEVLEPPALRNEVLRRLETMITGG